MEKFNLNFKGSENVIKSICWILSLLSWILLITSGIIAMIHLFNDGYLQTFIWIIPKWEIVDNIIIKVISSYVFYRPLQMLDVLIIIVFMLALIFTFLGFFVYTYLCCINKNSSVMEGMLGPVTRFHFIPLICASVLYLIGYGTNSDRDKTKITFSLIFSIIGLLTLVLISFKSNLESGPSYANVLIKKGVYGSYTSLFTYSISYSIVLAGILNENDPISFKKTCGVILTIVVGVVLLALSFLLKDFVIALMSTLIYLGATLYFYNTDKWIREHYNENIDGIIDIIMIILSVGAVGFTAYQNKGILSK